MFPRDGDDLDALLKNADVAMYHAKAEGRNRFSFYHDSMRQATAERLSLEHDLRRAIEREQFELHYQPQIDVDDQPHHRHRGADPLEPSDARHAVAAALHPRRRGGRADHGDLGVGVRLVADPAQRVAARKACRR